MKKAHTRRAAALSALLLTAWLAGCTAQPSPGVSPTPSPSFSLLPQPSQPPEQSGLPEGAEKFEAQLHALVPQYNWDQLPEGGAFTLDYQGVLPLIDGYGDRDYWCFDVYAGGPEAVTYFGGANSICRYYQDQETGQVYAQNGPDWFLSLVPGTFVYPESLVRDAVWSDIQYHAWSQVPETDFEYGHANFAYPEAITLSAVYPELGYPEGDGVAVYHCPIDLYEVPGWTDPMPYMVLLHSSGNTGYYYIGALDEQDAYLEEAVAALVDGWMEADVQYVNFVTSGSDAYDTATGYYTNDTYHFTWQLPAGTWNDILFRDTGRGVGVYYRPAYERYVARHSGVDDGGLANPLACGRLVEIIAGPENSVLPSYGGMDGLTWLPPCQVAENEIDAVPAPNGWYYASLTSLDWTPGSYYVQQYQEYQKTILLSMESIRPV